MARLRPDDRSAGQKRAASAVQLRRMAAPRWAGADGVDGVAVAAAADAADAAMSSAAKGMVRSVMRLCYHVAALLTLFSARPALAQLSEQLPEISGTGVMPGVTVLSRQRPEYDYPGVDLGAATVRSEVSSSTGYDDNVLGTSRNSGSVLQQTQVNLGAATNWSRNGLQASLQASDYRFLEQPKQSYTTWAATAGGAYEIGRDAVAVNYYHQNLAQTPRDLNTALLDRTIAYRIDAADVSYTTRFGRLQLRPGVQVALFDFDNGTVGGQPYLQTYRNRVVATPELRVGYELAPQRNVIAVVRNAVASYRERFAGQSVRDYNDTEVLAGLDYQLAGPFRFRLLVGYESRNFSSRTFKTIQAPVAELSVIWTPTGLTTVTGTLTRRIADSADETTAGLTATTGRLAVDHELYRNVLLHGEGGIDIDSFGQGGGSQTLYSLGAGASWLLNRHARLAATYAFTVRENGGLGLFGGSTSTGITGQPTGGNYTDNRVLLQLRLGL